LQEAKWESDFLAKMQDADGGFYFLVYPKTREYESGVLPDHGDAQVVWPKNTAVTAAAVAALAQCASSPGFKKHYPESAARYLRQAQLGWQFLMNAIARYGKAGAYQKITFYSDHYTHDDELAWAACELFVATGDAQYQAQQQQYQGQLQQNQAQQKDYQDRTAAYASLEGRYAAERAAYHRGVWPDRYSKWVIVERDAGLIGERVQLITGSRVGTVIDTAHVANGNVSALLVKLDDDKIVWIDASDVRYNRADGIVMTNLDRADLSHMADERV